MYTIQLWVSRRKMIHGMDYSQMIYVKHTQFLFLTYNVGQIHHPPPPPPRPMSQLYYPTEWTRGHELDMVFRVGDMFRIWTDSSILTSGTSLSVLKISM